MRCRRASTSSRSPISLSIVDHAIFEFLRSFAEALAIVLVVSFLSLGWRTGIVVALSVPLVLAITFVAMAVLGIDLHRITLGALIIALGLLVDDAIIAVEMMVVKIEQGWDRMRAAAFAWTSTAFPMLTGTLVTAAGFLPIGFANSSVGEYAGGIFWVVAIALVASWFVAVIFTPYLGVKLLPKDLARGGHANPHAMYETRTYDALRRVVAFCVRRRGLTVLATVAIFVASVLAFGRVQQQFFPLSERPELFFQMRLPEGTAIGVTAETARQAEKLLGDDPDVVTHTTYIGQGSPRFWLGLNPQLPNEAFAEIVIVAKDVPARERIKARIEKVVSEGALTEARVRVDRFNFGPPVGFPVQFRVVGPDPAKVRETAAEVREIMRANRNVIDPHLDWNEMTPSVRVVVDQERARALGLDPQTVAQTLQTLLSGIPVTTVRDGTERVDVVARAVRAERLDLGRIGDLTVVSRNGVPVPLSQVGRIEYAHEEPILWRRNRDMSITVRADVVDGVQAPDVTSQIWPALKPVRDKLAARLSPRDRRRRGGIAEGQQLDLRALPAHGRGDADPPHDPAAKLLAATPRLPDRAARHHRRLACAQPLRQAVRVRGAARADRPRRDDHAQHRHPGRSDRDRRRRRTEPARGDRRSDGAARPARGPDRARRHSGNGAAVVLSLLGADGLHHHGRAVRRDLPHPPVPACPVRALVPQQARPGRGGGTGAGGRED